VRLSPHDFNMAGEWPLLLASNAGFGSILLKNSISLGTRKFLASTRVDARMNVGDHREQSRSASRASRYVYEGESHDICD
jgi:hypothetical protein